ncbi:unnamed protein product [Dovyalis caffra]|uniref:Cytochrome P450 n=1 Tax=Dovyalis caffra TaxID=77055 RepID=A0AAV1RSN5_9ROSI|nr:unnamed protein product [Dovyalis caffra]
MSKVLPDGCRDGRPVSHKSSNTSRSLTKAWPKDPLVSKTSSTSRSTSMEDIQYKQNYLRLGVNPTLVVSSWELAKELFTINDLAVTSRPPFTAAKYLGYNFATFGFAPQGPYWRETRKITTSELLSNRRLNQLKDVRIHEVETSLKELYTHWDEKRMAQAMTVAGKRYYGSAVGDDDKIKAQQWQKAVRKLFKHLGIFVVRDALPFLGWLDIGGHEKAMKRTAKEIDSILEEWLEDHKRKRLLGETDQAEQDFMDVMLSVLQGNELAGYDADTVNKATSLGMIAGAGDTTLVTLTWAMSLLLNNKHVLVKVREELDRSRPLESNNLVPTDDDKGAPNLCKVVLRNPCSYETRSGSRCGFRGLMNEQSREVFP